MAKLMDQDGGAGERPLAMEVVAVEAPRATAAAPPPAPVTKSGGIRRVILAAVAVMVVGGAGWFGYNWWTNGRYIISTDDAYVAADTSVLSAKIAGYIKTVPAEDNAPVKAGDPLVVLDDSVYRIALAQANAQIASGQATIDRIGQQIVAGRAAVTSAQAQLASAQATADNAGADYDRVSALAAKQVSTTSALDTARTTLEQAHQAVAAANAAVAAASANVSVVTAQQVEAARALDQYKLARDQAQDSMDHTVIRAPFDGVVGNNAAQPGEYVQPGQRLLAVVPVSAVYVNANFKETQVGHLKLGQRVTVTVDAYPGLAVQGIVDSVAPASGSVFSLLPPDNATGNFTKIVQRIGVKIRLPGDVTATGKIRPGMSVTAAVDTRSAPSAVAAR